MWKTSGARSMHRHTATSVTKNFVTKNYLMKLLKVCTIRATITTISATYEIVKKNLKNHLCF